MNDDRFAKLTSVHW